MVTTRRRRREKTAVTPPRACSRRRAIERDPSGTTIERRSKRRAHCDRPTSERDRNGRRSSSIEARSRFVVVLGPLADDSREKGNVQAYGVSFSLPSSVARLSPRAAPRARSRTARRSGAVSGRATARRRRAPPRERGGPSRGDSRSPRTQPVCGTSSLDLITPRARRIGATGDSRL